MKKVCVACGTPAVTEWREYDKPSVWTCDKHYPEEVKKQPTVVWISDPPHYHAYGGPCSVCGDVG